MLSDDMALAFAGWSVAEARQRICKLLATGWSAEQLALMFGATLEEIDRLSGGHFIPEKDCANVG